MLHSLARCPPPKHSAPDALISFESKRMEMEAEKAALAFFPFAAGELIEKAEGDFSFGVRTLRRGKWVHDKIARFHPRIAGFKCAEFLQFLGREAHRGRTAPPHQMHLANTAFRQRLQSMPGNGAVRPVS
ncbi:hypothetical protein [Rhizobium leguminosarum]